MVIFRLDGSDHLPQLLAARILAPVCDVGGACLLYMHLGKGRPLMSRFRRSAIRLSNGWPNGRNRGISG
jgi:hypothetical protein